MAINVNKVKDDLPAAMKERAQKKQYSFPYLFDETQKIARDYGALFTPEFFVLDQNRRVIYMGAMDDNADASKATQNYLEQAVDEGSPGSSPKRLKRWPRVAVFATVGRGVEDERRGVRDRGSCELRETFHALRPFFARKF